MGRKEGKKNRVTVVMGDPMRDKIESLAEENDRSVSDFCRLVLKEYIEALEGDTQVNA